MESEGSTQQFFGASGPAPCSRFLPATCGVRLLLDRGLLQGGKHLRNRDWETPLFAQGEMIEIAGSGMVTGDRIIAHWEPVPADVLAELVHEWLGWSTAVAEERAHVALED